MSSLAQSPTTSQDLNATARPVKTRMFCIDALRGTVMSLMLGEALHFSSMGEKFPQSSFWAFISFHTEHVPWQGGSLHDMIQPGFSFLVGAALPYSLASRRARGQSTAQILLHALWRSVLLICLGIFLRSMRHPHTNFTFEDTLTQIGLGYTLLVLTGFLSWRWQAALFGLISVAFWLAFVLYPAPPPDFPYASVGVPADWPHLYQGFQAHWNKNSSLAWAFDRWFLNLFPREKPFEFNGGGWSTLSFIPTLATMILGLLAGEWMRSGREKKQIWQGLAGAGVALIVTALALQAMGISPIVKRIWTSGFTFYSGGWVLLMLAFYYGVMDVWGYSRWAFPLMVVGANSIAAYVMSWTMEGFFRDALVRHLGIGAFSWLGPEFVATLQGAGVLLILWLILFWMYQRKIFIRI